MQMSACRVTPTWAGDRLPFELLCASIRRSPLAELEHYVVVETEDADAFSNIGDDRVHLLTTAETLPADLETQRLHARRRQIACGRHLSRVAGSLRRHWGWPSWPGHTGWHMQQIVKLMLAKESGYETVVAVDSDVVVTPRGSVADFVPQSGTPQCFSCMRPTHDASRKVRHWNLQAERLFGDPDKMGPDSMMETFFDTPFVFHAPAVEAMCTWLEERHGAPWWQLLLEQAPRRWSEFATYRSYLRHAWFGPEPRWREPHEQHFIFDASDPRALRARVAALLADGGVHFITVHSQSSGRALWQPENYVPALLELIDEAVSPAS